jgi:hypothetical protein
VDALTDPSLQRLLPIVLAAIGAVGAAMFLGVLWSGRRPMQARTRLFRQRLGVVGLFFVVAAGAAYALLATPAEPDPGARFAAAPPAAAPESDAGAEIVSARRFSSAKLPALSLDAPEGWRLELDEKGRKLNAASEAAHLLVSTAVLTEAVDVQAFLAQLADTQRTLGFDVGATFSDRIGDLPAAGFLATGPTRSVCTWMVKRDTHLATSLICTADGKKTAREACRGPLASVRWRPPARGGHL